MSKKQFPKVDSSRGAPMGRMAYGSIQECFPRTVRLFKVNLDSQGYDDGGAYWGIGAPLWCAIGEHYYTGFQSRAFVRADSREHAIVLLKIEDGLLIQGIGKRRIAMLQSAAQWHSPVAKALLNALDSLGYDVRDPAYQRARGF